uniref:ribonucleoside-diphosphate reductase n=1 Tax=Marseillevirus LCMAC201 TaxID=2506605 RepID=A0A481YWK2_9VIRU|nr:MAG: ribonucleoside diphosphate reductase, beta subunit [Marseillevirus LCMAC201]
MSNSKFQRYSLFPIQYPNLYKFYEDQRDNFWVPNEIDLEVDVKEWREKLCDDDRHFLIHTLSFFAQADGVVLQNLDNNFSVDIDIPEASIFYGIQAGIEAIHWEMYALLIQTLITDSEVQDKAFHAIENYPCIRQKADWILPWMDNEKPFLGRLVAFACIEGIFFSSAFASIFYYKKRGLLPGLTLSNKFIARDEGLHRDFGCELFKLLRKSFSHKYHIDDEDVYEIVDQSVIIEENFVKNSLNVELIGINSGSMQQYVRYVADHLLVSLGLDKRYHDENPFDWMELISLTSKQNFFEGRVSEYKKNRSDHTFAIDDEF